MEGLQRFAARFFEAKTQPRVAATKEKLMQVRVRESDKSENCWIIEYRHWWWPFWRFYDTWNDHATAEKFALRLKYPAITKIR